MRHYPPNERFKITATDSITPPSLTLLFSTPPTNQSFHLHKTQQTMIALEALHTSPALAKHVLLYARRISNTKNCMLCLCKSNDSDSSSAGAKPDGDTKKQELLARIAMIQTQKVRLTDYLDERSAYLTQFAEEANAEFDKIGEDALKGLDEASSRIMENIESQMQAYEESAEMNRMEIAESENKAADFEGQIERDRNEGMFFKNLGTKPPVDKAKAKEEAKKIKDVAKEKAGSKLRKNIYLALMGLISLAIANSFITSSADWRKVAVFGAILVGLITQFSYEQALSSDLEKKEKNLTDKEKK